MLAAHDRVNVYDARCNSQEASSPAEHILVRHSCPRALDRAKLWAALPEEKTASASSSKPRGSLNSTGPWFPSRASTYCRSTGCLAGRRPTSPCATPCPPSFSIAFDTYRPLSSATQMDYNHPTGQGNLRLSSYYGAARSSRALYSSRTLLSTREHHHSLRPAAATCPIRSLRSLP
jgi:hypothetical protein